MTGKPSGSYQDYTSNSKQDQLNSNLVSAIYRIKQTVNQLNQLNKQLGTSKDSPKLRDNIEEILSGTKGLLNEAMSNLRSLSKIGGQEYGLTFDRTKKELSTEVEKFCDIEKIIVEKLKKPIGFNAASSNFYSEENNDKISDERESLLKQKRITELDGRMEFIKDRETKIIQIENDINDINKITTELAGLVYEQNSLIDNISSNVERTHDHVESGNEELVQANRYAAKGRKKLLILIFIISVIALVIGLIIFLTVRKK